MARAAPFLFVFHWSAGVPGAKSGLAPGWLALAGMAFVARGVYLARR